MRNKLNAPSNADDQSTPDNSAASETELTAREIAIIEGRDPDEVVDAPEGEQAAEVGDEPEQPAGEVADLTVSDPPAAPSAPWYGEYDRAYAEQHGLSEWHLQQFDSRDEFRKAASILEVASARRKAEPAPAPTPAPEKKPEPEYVDEPVVDGKVNVEWYRKNGYEEATIKAFEAQRAWQDKIESQFAEQKTSAEQRQKDAEEAEYNRQLQAFHEACDHARPDFYGKVYDEYGNVNQLTPQQLQRRDELYEEIYWHTQRMVHEQTSKGLKPSVPSYSALIKQAEPRAPFASELNRRSNEQQASAAQALARNIRPAAGSAGAGTAKRASSPPTTENVAEIAHDPDVIDAWERASTKSR